MVTDQLTGLVWQRCNLGQMWDGNECAGTAETYNWLQALVMAESNTENNKQWRLPNIKELWSIVENACVAPAVNEVIFPETQVDNYWSSTPSYNNALGVWSFNFSNGHNGIKNKNLQHFVRLVAN